MRRFVLAGIVAVVTSLGISKASAVELYLRITNPNIEGEATIKGYEGAINVDHFGISVSASISPSPSGGHWREIHSQILRPHPGGAD